MQKTTRSSLTTIAAVLFALAAGPALAEWQYLSPDDSQPDVHRVFSFGEDSDDRLEIACNADRRDLFYSAADTVSDSELEKVQSGEPTLLIRIEGVGVVPLDTDHAYQEQGRLIFVTAVKPALIEELAKSTQPVAAGMRANGEIFRQDVFPVEGIADALGNLAAGCGF